MLTEQMRVLLIDDAVGGVNPAFKGLVRDELVAEFQAGMLWQMEYSPEIHAKVLAALSEYAASHGKRDPRAQIAFRVCRNCLYHEGHPCPGDDVRARFSNEGVLEMNIAFGYIALAWHIWKYDRAPAMTPQEFVASRHSMN